jgi:hypothetical protein
VVVTSDDEHSELRRSWVQLRGRLLGVKERLDFGDTWQVEISDKADRLSNLVHHLDAAVVLSDQFLYAPALAVTRTSLEHVVVDWLVMRGKTSVQRIKNVPPDVWETWEAERAAGAAWTADIVQWSRTKRGEVTIRRRGLFSGPDEDGHREQMSIHYFLLDQYDGLMGKPADQKPDGVLTGEELRALAAENELFWLDHLRWAALVQLLADSDLLQSEDEARLNSHYRFLSSFAHPVADNQSLLYGRHLRGTAPHYDHYASELVLLYVINFAVLELRAFRDGVGERVGVTLRDDGLESVLATAERATEYFWFMGDRAHSWDVHRAVNRAATQAIREDATRDLGMADSGGAGGIAAGDDIRPAHSGVSFPRNPLERLVSQHAHAVGRVREAAYSSPWPRSDALPRT